MRINSYSKEDRKFQSYWKKDVCSGISFAEIRGGCIEPVPQACRNWVNDVIEDFMIRNEDAVVLFEDVMFDSNDEVVKESGLQYFEYMGNLYYFITRENFQKFKDDIGNALDLIGLGFNDTIILTRNENSDNIEALKFGDSFEQCKMIEILVKNAEDLIFTAFDQQGYVMWEL